MPCPWVLWRRGPGWWEQELSPNGWETWLSLLTPPGGSFPTWGVCSCARANGHSPSGAVFSWARPRELWPLGLPGPPPPALCPQLRAAWALPRFTPLCHGLGTPGVSWNDRRVAWFPVSGSPSSVAPCPVSWKSLVHGFSCFFSWTDESLSCLSPG